MAENSFAVVSPIAMGRQLPISFLSLFLCSNTVLEDLPAYGSLDPPFAGLRRRQRVDPEQS